MRCDTGIGMSERRMSAFKLDCSQSHYSAIFGDGVRGSRNRASGRDQCLMYSSDILKIDDYFGPPNLNPTNA